MALYSQWFKLETCKHKRLNHWMEKSYLSNFPTIHKTQKKYIIGNVYRLPSKTVNDLQSLNDEFIETLETYKSSYVGTNNINLLKIYKKNKIYFF